jgi:hypothetical protein
MAVSGVSDLYGWEFQLGWNSTLLDAVNVSEGPFLKAGRSTFFTYKVNATAGNMIVDCTLFGNIPGVSGDGTLGTITFYAKSVGQCPLDLHDVILLNSLEQPIPYQAVADNIVTILHPGHDVAVIGVEPLKTIVAQGYTTYIAVTVKNYGIFSETFNTTAYVNTTAIQTQTLTLTSGNSIKLKYTWNTTGFAKGNYTVSAYAWPVPGETNTENNVAATVIIETILGDVTGDGKVDIIDIATIAKAYGSYPGHPKWNPNADLDDNNKIDIMDIAKAAKNYGKTDP